MILIGTNVRHARHAQRLPFHAALPALVEGLHDASGGVAVCLEVVDELALLGGVFREADHCGFLLGLSCLGWSCALVKFLCVWLVC